MPGCAKCNKSVTGEDVTVCRICRASVHVSCAGVDVVDSKYGCEECFRIPGNEPRLRRANSATSGEEGEQTLQAAPKEPADGAYGGTTVPDMSAITARSSGAIPKQSALRHVKSIAGTDVERMSVASTCRRESQMLNLLQEQAEMMKAHASLLQSFMHERKGSSVASSRRRVADWVSQSSRHNVQRQQDQDLIASTPAPGPIREIPVVREVPRVATPPRMPEREFVPHVAMSPRVNQNPQYDQPPVMFDEGSEWSTIVGRVRDSAEFLACVQRAQRGTGRYPNHLRNKTPPELPKFSGDPLTWLDFITYFLETTAEYEVNPVKNVERIRHALGNEQLQVFNSSLVTSAAFAEALDQIRMRWGDPQDILAALEKDLSRAPAVWSDGTNLWMLMNKTRRLVTYVRAIGYTDVLTSCTLVRHLEAKLPFCMAMTGWGAAKHRSGDASLLAFDTYLQAEFATAMRTGRRQVYAKASGDEKKNPSRVVNTIVSTSTTSPGEDGEPPCRHCQGEHPLGRCNDYLALQADDRLARIRSLRLCWNCLKQHPRPFCRSKRVCGNNGCKFKHHPSLHEALLAHFAKASPSVEPGPSQSSAAAANPVTTMVAQDGPLFKIIPVTLSVGERSVDTFCFIDEGSSVSLIEDTLARELDSNGPLHPLTLKWANDQYMTDRTSRRVDIEISARGGRRFQLGGVNTVQDLQLPVQSLDDDTLRTLFGDTERPCCYENGVPRILLGLPHAHLVTPKEVREDISTGRVAVNTALGWVVYGGPNSDSSSHVTGTLRVCHMWRVEEDLTQILRDFHDTEAFGVRAAPHIYGREDAAALETLQATVRQVGTRYEAGLLWADKSSLPDTLQMCANRMRTLQKRLARDTELASKLHALIADYHSKGYCSDVVDEPTAGRTWYLPVFPVLHPNKPEKVRLVWDAAAKAPNGRSLNSYLLSGPDLLNPLAEILLRFRERPVAVTADVKEMFHQVRIRDEDHDAQRFLWPTEDGRTLLHKRLNVASFGATCSPTIALYVQNTNAGLFAKTHPRGVREIQRSFYVDDNISSYDDEATAGEVFAEIKYVQACAGFELGKVRLSHPKALEATGIDTGVKTLSGSMGSVLGMEWECVGDLLRYAVRHVEKVRLEPCMTRRKMLSGTMSLFDPLGLAAILVIKAKIIMKETLPLDWDQEVPSALRDKWCEWADSLSALNDAPVPRWHGLSTRRPWEIHTFVDASEEAFAAVAYFRGEDNCGNVVVSLAMAKTRVAPVRGLTMPRMELQAAVLGARLTATLRESASVPIGRQFLWTDSTDCVCWLKSKHRRYHAFVAARVNEILSITGEDDWRWVPTDVNVADLATRFGSPVDLGRWQRGPEFLQGSEDSWPDQSRRFGEPKEQLQQVLSITKPVHSILPNPDNTDGWRKLVNATSYVLRVILRKPLGTGPPSSEEISRAHEEIFRQIQLESFGHTVAKLKLDPKHQVPGRQEDLESRWPITRRCVPIRSPLPGDSLWYTPDHQETGRGVS